MRCASRKSSVDYDALREKSDGKNRTQKEGQDSAAQGSEAQGTDCCGHAAPGQSGSGEAGQTGKTQEAA